jgi:hypothetical protein
MARSRRRNWYKAAADEFANMSQDYQNDWKDLYVKTREHD